VRTPTAAELLQVWEQGAGRSASARSLLLLAVACDDVDDEQLSDMPVGRRNSLLLELRSRLFGSAVSAVDACVSCGSPVEVSFDAAALISGSGAAESPRELELMTGGSTVRFRLPNSRDLLAIPQGASVETARATLFDRCVLAVSGVDGAHQSRSLSDESLAAVAGAMAQADLCADLRLAFTCPGCSSTWEAAFDAGRFLWREVQAWAHRMLRDVDTLARAYHWRELDVLALSSRRRRVYLEMCRS
jgi:hypothetical protein